MLSILLKGKKKQKDKTTINWKPELLALFETANIDIDDEASIFLVTDTSNVSIGGVLEVHNSNGERLPLTFF